jgi:hypothetical protein
MKLKAISAASVSFTQDGRIAIEQWGDTYNEPVFVYLTLDQFRNIQQWVDDHQPDIEAAWNNGVDDGKD